MEPNRMFDAVIFDCDGVIADCEPLHDAATREEAQARGLTIDNQFFLTSSGMRLVDQIQMLSTYLEVSPSELLAAREARFWSTIDARFAAVPDTPTMMKDLHEGGFPIAVASSGTREWVDYVIARLELHDLLSAVVTAEDVARPKPDPEPYCRAARILAVPPDRCVAIEDSPTGYQSAIAAGCQVVVLNQVGRSTESFPQAKFIASSAAAASEFLLGNAAIRDQSPRT